VPTPSDPDGTVVADDDRDDDTDEAEDRGDADDDADDRDDRGGGGGGDRDGGLEILSRAVLIGAYLVAPKTDWTFYVFAAGLGFTWLATVPPTAAIVGKLFGVRYLATLFGLTLLSHQIGGFLGAYLGGLAFDSLGSYQWMWYADMALAAAAGLVNLPIREAPIRAAGAAA